MLVSVLTLNVEWQRKPLVMHRGSFHNFAATQHVPLHFPVPGDRVAVMRTGLHAHIQYIRDAVLRPRRWGRDGAGAGGAGASSCGAAHAQRTHSSGGTATPGSVSAGAASGERGAGGLSRQGSLQEPAARGDVVVKSENMNACNATVPSNGVVNGVTEADTGPADMDVDKATAQRSTHVKTEDPQKPVAALVPEARDQKPPINCASLSLAPHMHATHAHQQNDLEGAEMGSTALDSARGQQAGSGEGGSTGAAVALPPVPPPTPKQEAWLQEIERVDEVAQQLRPVELMTVAAVAYVPADIPEVVQR